MTNRDQLITELAEHITRQVISGLKESIRCCPTCIFFQKNETCRNTINCPQEPARPPADIIAFGCKLYIPDAGI
jgi:recombinational DNA repair protein RecR